MRCVIAAAASAAACFAFPAQAGWTGCQMGVVAALGANEALVKSAPDYFAGKTYRMPNASGSGYGGGAEFGCDLSLPGFVLGVAAHYDFLSISSSKTTSSHYQNFSIKIDDSMTVGNRVKGVAAASGRIGLPVGAFLFYLRGGVAMGRAEQTYNYTEHIDRYDQLYVTDLAGRRTRHGLLFGGGVEFEARSAFSVKLEYARYDFGSCDCKLAGTVARSASIAPKPVVTAVTGLLRDRLAVDVLKAGAFYRF